MKKFLKTALLLVITASLAFAKVDFAKDYQTALSMAKKENKNILLMLTKKECPACWWMKNVAFKDEALAKRIEDNFVSVSVDVELEEIPMNLEYVGTPTFYFLNTKEDQLSRIDGARNIKEFNERLDVLLP